MGAPCGCRSPTRARASIRATSSARSCSRARPPIAPAGPDWDARTGIATIRIGRLPAGHYALALRAGDYAESREALAITISPQHVRTRVLGLVVEKNGAVHGGAAPVEATLDARRQVDGS